jgi:hypothetical protein
MTVKYAICFDTICTGFSPIMENDRPVLFDSEAEAQAEIDSDPKFYEDCFVVKADEIGHKTVWYPS